jgi:hypothetical protein
MKFLHQLSSLVCSLKRTLWHFLWIMSKTSDQEFSIQQSLSIFSVNWAFGGLTAKVLMAFGVWDYVVFITTLLISASIGVYARFSGGKQKTADVSWDKIEIEIESKQRKNLKNWAGELKNSKNKCTQWMTWKCLRFSLEFWDSIQDAVFRVKRLPIMKLTFSIFNRNIFSPTDRCRSFQWHSAWWQASSVR